MTKILKLFFVIILFLSISLVTADFDCKSFLSFSNFILYFVRSLLPCFSNIISLFFFFIVVNNGSYDYLYEVHECEVDNDCPQDPLPMKCIDYSCVVHNEEPSDKL